MLKKAPKCESQNEPFGDVAVGEWEPCNFLDFFHVFIRIVFLFKITSRVK